MLLRQAEPADVDGYISAAAAMTSQGEDQQPQDTSTAPRTDPLDDVFGSDDDSPVFEDDYDNYESNPHIRITGRDAPSSAQHSHPSDIHRLRQEHTTSGYREGITAAKASSVQAGFDEGFGLGATIGLRAGYLLGVLEGVAAALSKGDSNPSSTVTAEDRAEAGKLLAQARAELRLQAVFNPEYWDSDGTWRYEVGKGEEEEGEVLFAHVAEAHPLVRRWTVTVNEQMRRWGLEEQLPLLQRREDEDASGDAGVEPVAARVKAVAPSQPDAKVASDALSW